ncbi:hypothetical protein [Rugosimonospora africana]|uniref:Uncharacterized protein n=1 Tax=Rugosimonospora africana TaxID=556532 RepID=A0A8J3R0K7_9ACTN|nr:hypothetical protein [Rugosimonospora africana]GIH19597.1 hypothetical protein Raf01_77690 [Rugosimonospora africana]
MFDDEYTQVRELLHAAEVPPPRIDLGQAIAAGRRRRRARHAGWVAGATALVVVAVAGGAAVAGTPRGAPTAAPGGVGAAHSATATATSDGGACIVQALPGLGNHMVDAVDPSGSYVTSSQAIERSGAAYPVVWHDGTAVEIPLPNGADAAQINAVNVHGAVVGMASHGPHGMFAFVYRNGTTTALAKLPGYTLSSADGINATGDIVGNAFNDQGDEIPVIWPAAAPGTVHRLGTAAGTPYAIADDGTIVGSRGDGDAPWVWNASNGTAAGLPLTTPADQPKGQALAVRGDWAAGWVGEAGGGHLTSARWNLRTGAVQLFPGLFSGPPRGVNARGDLVTGPGEASSGNTAVRGGTALLLAVGPYRADIASASWISDDGTTLIGTVKDGNTDTPVRWHCPR